MWRNGRATVPGASLERVEQAPSEPEPARSRSDPHPLDLGRRIFVVLDRAAADRLAVEVGDEELARGRAHLVRMRRRADCGIETPLGRGERAFSSAMYSARQYWASGSSGSIGTISTLAAISSRSTSAIAATSRSRWASVSGSSNDDARSIRMLV